MKNIVLFLVLTIGILGCKKEEPIIDSSVCSNLYAFNYVPSGINGRDRLVHNEALCIFGVINVFKTSSQNSIQDDDKAFKLGEVLEFQLTYNTTVFNNPVFTWSFENSDSLSKDTSIVRANFNKRGRNKVSCSIKNIGDSLEFVVHVVEYNVVGIEHKKVFGVLIEEATFSSEPNFINYNATGECNGNSVTYTTSILDKDSVIELQTFDQQYNNVEIRIPQPEGAFGSQIILSPTKQIDSYTLIRDSLDNFDVFYSLHDTNTGLSETCNLTYTKAN